MVWCQVSSIAVRTASRRATQPRFLFSFAMVTGVQPICGRARRGQGSSDWWLPTGAPLSSLGEETVRQGGERAVVRPGLIMFHCTTSVQVANVALIGLVIMTTAGWRLIMVIN